MRQKSLRSIGRMLNDIPTSQTLFDLNQLTSFAEDSPAKMCQWLEREKVLMEKEQLYGEKCSDSFAKLSPDGLWLKMSQGYCQVTMEGSLETFSGTWMGGV